MTQAKRQFVQKYIKTLSDMIDVYNSTEPDRIDQVESMLFDTIFEIRNVFSQELPNIDNAILLRHETGIRDANSVLGILKLYLVGDEETNSDEGIEPKNTETIPKIFISHRSADKKVADILESFLTNCGISYSNIFCSSLPGNDVEEKISSEVKEALKSSILNIVLLSADYYKSAYCQNEAGIIWFLDIEKIVIALPEIDENVMEGFLNSEHKIRRLSNKNDLYSISDIVKKSFPEFIVSNAKLNANIERVVDQYNEVMKARTVSPVTEPDVNNNLEKRILSKEFSDQELIILYYFYDTQTNFVSDDLININKWLVKKKIDLTIKDGFNILVDDGIVEYTYGGFEKSSSYKMVIGAYRELRRLSQKAVDLFEHTCSNHKEVNVTEKSENPVENLIIKGFTTPEVLLVKYILDLERENLFAGWQSEQEIKMIHNWEEINQLNDCLSRSYVDALSKLEIRKFIEPCAKTSHGNTKEYRLRDTFLENLNKLGQAALDKIQEVLEESKYIEPDLPF